MEGILNSRPLTYCSSDPSDEHVLTTNHFLYGQMGGQLAPRVIDDIVFNPRNRWRFTQDLVTKCWRRLMKEYLPTLNTRNKWVEEKRNIAPGDVVLRVDTGNPRGHWPLGRIQEVFPVLTGRSEMCALEQQAWITCGQSQSCVHWSLKKNRRNRRGEDVPANAC